MSQDTLDTEQVDNQQLATQTYSEPAPVPIDPPEGTLEYDQKYPNGKGTSTNGATSANEPPVSDKYANGADKEDWILTRAMTPEVSTEDLFNIYGEEGFRTLKPKEEYWKNPDVQKKFTAIYGSSAKYRFDDFYENSIREYSAFKMGQYTHNQTGYELVRDDITASRMDTVMRFTNLPGTIKQGYDWSAPTRDIREAPTHIKIKDGSLIELTPESLKELEKDPTFGAVAYSDLFSIMDPTEGVNGVYLNAVYDGQVIDELTGKWKDVRNDQIVSRWDIDTGDTSIFGIFDINLSKVLKNNKLEADSILDYAKIAVRTPINMAVNMLDTVIQISRAAVAGGYGVASVFSPEEYDVRTSEMYKWLTTKGVRTKANLTSSTREALEDGFFGSLEAQLTTIADVALQVAVAGGLGKIGSGVSNIITTGLSESQIMVAQKRAAEVAVRGTLTALAVKDSYNEALENGFTTGEASVISGAMAVGLWKATSFSTYILGDYEEKLLRENIKKAVIEEQRGVLTKMFSSIPAATSLEEAGAKKAWYSLQSMDKAVKKGFTSYKEAISGLPNREVLYAARQESLEEMAEELAQDVVRQGATAYGYLINDATERGKGRYMSIFEEGYFEDAVKRYATSGIAGGIGGPMGIAMHGRRSRLNPLTSTSSITDIILAGHKNELLVVMENMKNQGLLGPKELSTSYDENSKTFLPIIEGQDQTSLADVVYNTFLHDINVADTFISSGLFGQAGNVIRRSEEFKKAINENSMRSDYASLMGQLLEFHTKNPEISMEIYKDIDALSEEELYKKIPESILKPFTKSIETKRAEIIRLQQKYAETKDDDENASDVENASIETKKPKTTPKEGKEGEDKATIGRLEKEIELASGVNTEAIIDMLSVYRKIRAIATGIASEDYLISNEQYLDNVLGDLKYRDKKFISLGPTPYKDMLMAMRLRYMDNQKINIQIETKKRDVEAALKKLSAVDEATRIEGLVAYMAKEDLTLLSSDSISQIKKALYDNKLEDFTALFDVNSSDTLFEKDASGEPTQESLIGMYKQVLSLHPDNAKFLSSRGVDLLLNRKTAVIKRFFSNLASNPHEAKMHVYTPEDGNDLYEDPDYTSAPLIRYIANSTDQFFKDIVNTALNKPVLDLGKIVEKIVENEKSGVYVNKDTFKTEGMSSLFARAIGKSLSTSSLVEDGISAVKTLLDSGFEGVYTYSDSSELSDILKQIEFRQRMVAEFSKLSSNDGSMYSGYLARFRQNVLNILDFKYDYNSPQVTELEPHSYKDYSATSDFFIDFLYDPIRKQELDEKQVGTLTVEEQEYLNKIKRASVMVNVGVVPATFKRGTVPTIEDISVVETAINEQLLFAELENRFGDNLDGAVRFLEKEKILYLRNNIFTRLNPTSEDVRGYYLEGNLKLLVSKWLFEKSKNIIETIASKTTVLPYLEVKKKDVEFTTGVFFDFLGSQTMPKLLSLINAEIPDYDLEDKQAIVELSFSEKGSLNIEIERAIYKVFNNLQENKLPEAEHEELAYAMESYLAGISDRVDARLYNIEGLDYAGDYMKEFSILAGALTTDFTPYYAKFKRNILKMKEDDIIVAAPQEHAAKYAGAYVYSNNYKELVDHFIYQRASDKSQVFQASFITGRGGSGKSSATITFGLSLAMEILADSGYENTAVLPVSIYPSQVDIITESVGKLSNGLPGMSVSELINLLKDAINSNDTDAIDKLKKVGAIVIDEATYVTVDPDYTDKIETPAELRTIADSIAIFNNRYNSGGHEMRLVLLGDPKQSGASIIDNGGNVGESSVNPRYVNSLAYMSSSFRSRNNLLSDSIYSISENVKKAKVSNASNILVTEGLRYGITNNRWYGARIVDAKVKTDSSDFFALLNDTDGLVKNVEDNIIKVIEENKVLRAEGKKEKKFKVLISPESTILYDDTPSAMKTLSEKVVDGEEYSKYFKVVKASQIGGSEANYVFAELPAPVKAPTSIEEVNAQGKALHTAITRPFDFVYIVNKNPSIVFTNSSASKLAPEVIIPNDVLDNAAKQKLKENYLEIFSNIEEDGGTGLLDEGEGEEDTDDGSSMVMPPSAPGSDGTSPIPATVISPEEAIVIKAEEEADDADIIYAKAMEDLAKSEAAFNEARAVDPKASEADWMAFADAADFAKKDAEAKRERAIQLRKDYIDKVNAEIKRLKAIDEYYKQNIDRFINTPTGIFSPAVRGMYFNDMSDEFVDIMDSYLANLYIILDPTVTYTEEEVDNAILNIDAAALKIKPKVPDSMYKELVDLSLFMAELKDDRFSDAANIFRASITSFKTFVNTETDVLSISIGNPLENYTVKDYFEDFEEDISIESNYSINKELFKAAIELVDLKNSGIEAGAIYDIAKKAFDNMVNDFNKNTFSKGVPNISAINGIAKAKKAVDKMVLDIVYKRAVAVLNSTEEGDPEESGEFNVSDVQIYLDEFERFLVESAAKDPIKNAKKYLAGLRSSLQAYKNGGKKQVKLPNSVHDIFSSGYNTDLLLEELIKVGELVVQKLTAVAIDIKNDITEASNTLARMKEALGIPDNVVSKYDLYKAISAKADGLIKKLSTHDPTKFSAKEEQQLLQDMNNLTTIREAWDFLYRSATSEFGTSTKYGRTFVYRGGLNRKETLEDYKNMYKRSGAGIFSVDVTAFNGRAIPNNTRLMSGKESQQELFNFGGNKVISSPVNKLIMRAINNPQRGELDVIFIVSDGLKSYTLSQFDNSLTQGDKSNLQVLIENKARELFEKHTGAAVMPSINVPGAFYVDVEISGKLKDLITALPGGLLENDAKGDSIKYFNEKLKVGKSYIVPTPLDPGNVNAGFKELSLKELSDSINVSKDIYIDVHKAEGGADNKANLRGEMIVVYSTNKSFDLNSKETSDMLLSGAGYSALNRLQDNKGIIPTQAGFAVVKMKVPFDLLGDAVKKDPSMLVGESVSIFSLALQTHFSEKLAEFNKGDKVKTLQYDRIVLSEEIKNSIINSKAGDIITINSSGDTRSIELTDDIIKDAKRAKVDDMISLGDIKKTYKINDQVLNTAKKLNDDLEAYYSGLSQEEASSIRAKVESAIKKMRGGEKEAFDTFTGEFLIRVIHSRLNSPMPVIKRTESGGYAFRINDALKYASESYLRRLDKLSSLAAYTLKPAKQEGGSTYLGKLAPGFQAFRDYFVTTYVGMKVPTYQISSEAANSAVTAMDQIINNVSQKKESAAIGFTPAENAFIVEYEAKPDSLEYIVDNLWNSVDGIDVTANKILDQINEILRKISGIKEYSKMETDFTTMSKVLAKRIEEDAIDKSSKINMKDSLPDFIKNNYIANKELAAEFLDLLNRVVSQYIPTTEEETFTLNQFVNGIKNTPPGVSAQDRLEQLIEEFNQDLLDNPDDKDVEKLLFLLKSCKL